MHKDFQLGDFEAKIIGAIIVAPRGEAYGAVIHKIVEGTMKPKRPVSLGAVYTTLDRLEKKGLVTSWFSAPLRERGGRARRCFKLLGAGARAYEEKQRLIQVLPDLYPGFARG